MNAVHGIPYTTMSRSGRVNNWSPNSNDGRNIFQLFSRVASVRRLSRRPLRSSLRNTTPVWLWISIQTNASARRPQSSQPRRCGTKLLGKHLYLRLRKNLAPWLRSVGEYARVPIDERKKTVLHVWKIDCMVQLAMSCVWVCELTSIHWAWCDMTMFIGKVFAGLTQVMGFENIFYGSF